MNAAFMQEAVSLISRMSHLFMVTLFQPPLFDDAFFDEQMKLMNKEFAKLKETMETHP
jgi:hypothetical protein